MSLTELLLKRFLNLVFVETGTFHGDSVQLALNVGFKRIYSIESAPMLYQLCRQRFAGRSEVNIIHGDSAVVMPQLVTQLQDRATFWLDAHSFDPNRPAHGTQWPLLQELAALAAPTTPRKDHTLLIDVVRVFESHFKTTKAIVEAAVRAVNPAYVITYENSEGFPRDILAARLPETPA